jgi:dihydropteroate synthase
MIMEEKKFQVCVPRLPMNLPSGGVLDFSGPALVMAIVNCSEDSFYAPSRARGEHAVRKALEAEEDGAAIIDFGGESTRPGAAYIGEKEELSRLIPVLEAYRRRSSLPVSIDTRKAAVARAALDSGADIINDISALEDDEAMAPLCAERGAAVVLMHKKGIPRTMQNAPGYDDPVSEVAAYLRERVRLAGEAGIKPEKIILDPGIGFGKRTGDNLELLRRLAEICGKDYPLLVGVSRKTFIGDITGRDAAGRLAGTLAANAAAVMNGAAIIRVHDVREGADLVKVLYAIAIKSHEGMEDY